MRTTNHHKTKWRNVHPHITGEGEKSRGTKHDCLQVPTLCKIQLAAPNLILQAGLNVLHYATDRAWGRKPLIVGVIRKNSRERCEETKRGNQM
ncbi:hypothetical protein TNCV_1218801 [Trichonephila clavipes]|nr:hypothetical protein TNCV_1218801 [Trichonephila clavipes]